MGTSKEKEVGWEHAQRFHDDKAVLRVFQRNLPLRLRPNKLHVPAQALKKGAEQQKLKGNKTANVRLRLLPLCLGDSGALITRGCFCLEEGETRAAVTQ